MDLYCLHAIGHSKEDYAAFAARTKHRVVAIDWPGHGDVPHDGVPASAIHYESLLALRAKSSLLFPWPLPRARGRSEVWTPFVSRAARR
jgi:pimeloyl-ACP methyl ester carboxylesterase